MSEQQLWDAYRASRSTEDRNALVEHYHGMLLDHATRLVRRLPATLGVEAEDLAHDAVPALMELLETYDPTRGIQFSTYATMRLIGAMRDSLRAMDWVPRLERQRQKANPEHPVLRVFPLATAKRNDFEDRHEQLREYGEPAVFDDPPKAVRDDFWKSVCRGLRRTERLVVLMYYREQMTMQQIGTTLQLSESRISQMMSSVMERIRDRHDVRDLLVDQPLSN